MPRVLIVDDDSNTRKVLKKNLTRHRYHVATAKDGKEALVALRADAPYDVLILDLFMPQLLGHEVLQAIVDEQLIELQRVIVFTAADSTYNATEYMRMGVHAYIAKPYTSIKPILRFVEAICNNRPIDFKPIV